ncbi:MAG: VCBS repeat-containing protein, partial [Verrucomicrobiota bacterium]|nr:VCBS repeat-containing protein [Verrucomicrobiota bacterium]
MDKKKSALTTKNFLKFIFPLILGTQMTAYAGRVEIRATGPEAGWVHLRNEAAISAQSDPAATGLRSRALASADFDEDGVPDLVTGYANSDTGGTLSIQRGNVDAIYPNSPGAQARRDRGEFTTAAFLPGSKSFAVPEAADFVGAGDFDADGHWDVVTARNGGDKLYWFRGDGRGGFAEPKIIYLPGAITSLITGEMNRADGLTDVVVGVVTSDGPRVLVFESPNGALRGEPESFVLPAPASALALGQLDDDSAADLAIATGNEVMIVHGRDRKLSLDAEQRATVKAAEVTRTVLESAPISIAVGDFTGDAKQQLAVLTADGNVRVLERGGASDKEFQANKAMTLNVATSGPDGASPHRLLVTKVSSLPKDDLLVFGGTKAVSIVTTGRTPALGQPNLTSAGSDRMSLAASLSSDSEVTAVLPMRLNASALKDLVLLDKSG